jgi:hypothetical protein
MMMQPLLNQLNQVASNDPQLVVTMGETMQVGITEAAKITRKNKSVIWRDTKAGKISATQDGKGQRVYNVAELERVYGRIYSHEELATLETGSGVVASNETQPSIEAEKLAVKLEFTERELNLLKDQLDEIKQDRDHWRNTAQTVLRALPAPVAATNDNPPKPPEKRNLWQRLKGNRTA